MFKNIGRAILALVILGSVGCANVSKMPLQEKSKGELSLAQKSILVAKVTIKNENKPGQQPTICCVFVKKEKKDFSFTEPLLVNDAGEQGKTYIISAAVEPGETNINMIRFFRQVPLLVFAMADLPFHQVIDVPANKVVYLGNINAVIKPRENDSQPRAGSVLPLVDQAVAGFSSGTFTATVTDQYDQDIQQVKQKFPKVAGFEFVNMTLPAWKYPDSYMGKDKDDKKKDKK
jgi:hypothetical protein